jgi:hypothetical protein
VAASQDVAAQLELLREAGRTKKVAPEKVLEAMAAVEAAHKQRPDQVQGESTLDATTNQSLWAA